MIEPVVSICCLTYNHESYIQQCIEGFMIQKTDFPFEVLIHDDASIDKTADIIREYEAKYPDIIKPIYQTENQFSKGVGVTRVYQFPRARGQYIALCEGDDYWTDPYKLQKQVDDLKANLDFVGVCTNYRIINEEGKTIKEQIRYKFIVKREHKLIIGLPKTLTVMYRNIPEALTILNRFGGVQNSDEALAVVMRNWGPIVLIDEIMGVYRRHSNGVFSSQLLFSKNKMTLESLEKIKDFCETNNLTHNLENKISDYHNRILAYYLYKMSFWKAITYYKNITRNIKSINVINVRRILIYTFVYFKNEMLRVSS